MLVQEIEPRIKSLTRQVNRLRKRGELEKELLELQTIYYSVVWHDLNESFNKANKEYLELEKEKSLKDETSGPNFQCCLRALGRGSRTRGQEHH